MSNNADDVFLQARDISDPAERAAYLAQACGSDLELLKHIQGLLANAAGAESFFSETDRGDETHVRTLVVRPGPEDPPVESEGQTIGRYKLLEKIGEGGCGVVYVAEQKEPVRRRVALKVIKLGMDTRQVIARFEAERQALAMMDHPNIAKVLDGGTTDQGRPYFVMELVRGIRITDYCDQNHLSTRERLDLFIKVCNAIQHAHQKGVVHRDIKPSNILVTLHDSVPVPKVIDFGIAKATQGRLTDATIYTQLHQFIGTPAYMSPEQAEMSGLDIDTRSDIYSAGVLLYELLTGMTPFDAQALLSQGLDAIRKVIREQDPLRPSTKLATLRHNELTTTARRRSVEAAKLASLLRGDLDWIVMKCLEKDRTRRYATASDIAADIQRHLNTEPVLACPPSSFYEFQKTVRRHKFGFAAAAAIILALAIGVTLATWQAIEARRAEGRARQAQHIAEAQQSRAESLTAQNLEQLVGTLTASGAERIEAGEAALALPWLVRALQIDEDHPSRQHLQRVRIAQLLRQVPQLHHFWTKHGSATEVKFSSDGIYAFAVGAVLGGKGHSGGGLGLWHVPTGNSIDLGFPTERILHAAFAPRGAEFAVIDRSGTIYLCNLDGDGPPIECEEPHPSGHHVVFSPDGTKLLSYGYNRLAKLWDAKTGRVLISRFEGNWGSNLRGGDFSADSQRVAILDYSGRHFVFDSNTGQLLNQQKRGGQTLGLKYSPDGQVFVTSGQSGEPSAVYVWDSQTDAEVLRFEQSNITSFDISPDSTSVASSSRDFDGSVLIWNLRSGELVTPALHHTDPVSMVRFSPDGRHVVTASWDGAAQVWDARTGEAVGPPIRHGAAVQSLDFDPSGRYLLTGCVDGTIRVWALSLMPTPSLTIHPAGGADRIAMDRGGRRLLTSNAGGLVQVYDAARGQPVSPPILLGFPVEQAEFVPGTDLVITASREPAVRFWDASTGNPHGTPITPETAGTFKPGDNTRAMFVTNPDGTSAVVAFSSASKSVFQVWSIPSGRPMSPATEGGSLRVFGLSSNGQTLATIRGNHSHVEFWSPTSDNPVGTPVGFRDFSAIGSFNAEGTIFALMTRTALGVDQPDFSALQAWHVQSGEVLIPPTFRSGAPGVLCYDPAGRRIAASYDNRLYLVDAADAQPMTRPMTHQARLTEASFSPDGRYLCSIDGSERLHVYDAATAQPITVPIRHPGGILQALFTDDSQRAVTACSDGRVRFWNLSPQPGSVEELTLRAQLLSGHKLDETGALSQLAAGECARQWEAWVRLRPTDLDGIPATPQRPIDGNQDEK